MAADVTAGEDPVLRGGTWETLWPFLLQQAAELGALGGFQRSMSAVVLARTAWDAFAFEFVARRELDANIRKMDFPKALAAISLGLSCSPPIDAALPPWNQLAALNKLRNEVVHYKARADSGPKGPNDLAAILAAAGAPPPESAPTWERGLLTAPTARWACTVVGAAIIAMETYPLRRRTPLATVRHEIAVALAPFMVARGKK